MHENLGKISAKFLRFFNGQQITTKMQKMINYILEIQLVSTFINHKEEESFITVDIFIIQNEMKLITRRGGEAI
jgi:hypothetical protein